MPTPKGRRTPPSDTPARRAARKGKLGSWRDIILIPPFHAWLGIVTERVEHGRAVVRLPFRDELIGNPAIPAIHGGIIAALVDLTGGVATFTLANAATPTIDMRIDYVRPALPKDTIADAWVVNAGKTIAFVNVDVTQDGTLVAQGRCIYSTKGAKPSRAPTDHPIG